MHAQIEVRDSLMLELNKTPEGKQRLGLLNQLAYLLLRSDPEQMLVLSEEAIALADDLNDLPGLALAYKNHGLSQYMTGDSPGAVISWLECLVIAEELQDEILISNINSNLGAVYYDNGQNDLAMEYFLVSLRSAEAANDSYRLATLAANIGNIYGEQQGFRDSALVYYQRSLELSMAIADQLLIWNAYSNMGNLYLSSGELDSAQVYFRQSMDHAGTDLDRASSMNGLGFLFLEKGEAAHASEYFSAAYEIGSREQSVFVMLRALHGLADIDMDGERASEAVLKYSLILELAEAAGLILDMVLAYDGLAEANAALGDYRKAYEYRDLQVAWQDTLDIQDAENRSMAQIAAYQVERKQNELEIEQLRGRKQKVGLIGALALGGMMLLLASGLFNRYRFIRRTKRTIESQKQEVESQRDLLFQQHETITDSITYAQRIQSAMLPSACMLDDIMPEYFVILKPKDIVSGDFYWVKEVQDHLVIVGADCTGHGVPGAFMSMLGMTILNDMINDRCFDAPSAILAAMRSKIKQLLVQEGNEDEQKDGMDLALAILDKKGREIHFAGANNPMYLVRQNGQPTAEDLDSYRCTEGEGYRLFDIKGDPQPIGIYEDEKPFRTHSIRLEKGDSFYLFSDGYIDQFGGEKRKKYMSGRFKKMLLSIQGLDMSGQREIIDQEIEDWMGVHEQIDDISVIGARV